MSRNRPGLATIAYGISTALLGLLILGFAVRVVPMIFDSIGGNGQGISIDQSVPYERLSSLDLKQGCGRPSCVMAPREVPVTILVLNGNGKQIALQAVESISIALFAIVLLWIVRNVIGSVREGDPFNRQNVLRLRKIGTMLLVGWPALDVLHNALQEALAATTPTGALGTDWNVPPAPGAILGGLIVLILAQVFAHGLKLREELEGTV